MLAMGNDPWVSAGTASAEPYFQLSSTPTTKKQHIQYEGCNSVFQKISEKGYSKTSSRRK